jgi:nicotinamide-nucleotide amidase
MTSEDRLVEVISRVARDEGLRVVTAESLTSGGIATRLGAGPHTADWFGGALVAYQEQVKFDVLGVDEGPVVTEAAAEQMAQGALDLFGADVAVSATGVGGPDPAEGKPAGTVFISVTTAGGSINRELHFDGGPEQVLEQTGAAAIALLAEAVAGAG